MNWLKVLTCLLVALALGLFIAALVTPWYRVRHHDGTTSHMGLYDSYDEGDRDHPAHNDTHSDIYIYGYNDGDVFMAESSPLHIASPPVARLSLMTSTKARQAADPSPVPQAPRPCPSSHPHIRQRRSLRYNDGWVTAIRVLLILTIVISFLTLCWSMYHAFVHGTSYGWDDSPYMTGTSYLAYMLLFWGFINGIIILSLAASFGPAGRNYDQGFGFNSAAFLLLLFSMCILCYPVSTPVILVSDTAVPGYAPYYGGRQWPPPSTTFGGPPYGKPTYAATESTTPTPATTTTGPATGMTVGPGAGTTATQTQPYTQSVAPGAGAGPGPETGPIPIL